MVEPFGWRTLHTLGMGVVCAPAYPDCTSAERHQGEIRRCEIRVRSGWLPFRDPPQGIHRPGHVTRGGLRALRRVRVPVKGGVASPAGLLSPEARRVGCLAQGPGRARLLHAGGASLIHVQLLRLPTLQYSSPRAGQPIKVARPAQKTTVDTEI